MTRNDRQKECLRRWLKAGGHGTLECATGFGKTKTALDLIDAFVTKNPESQTLIVVPTQLLKDQWIEKIDERGLGLNTRVEIINTVIKQTWSCDLLCIDECHLCVSTTFVQVFQAVEYNYILCLTGTLERLDMRHVILEKYAPVCDRITIEEAEANGWVAPHKEYVVMIKTDLSDYNAWTQKFNSYFSTLNYDFNFAMKLVTDPIARNKWAKQMGYQSKQATAIVMDWMRLMKKRKDFIMNHPKKLEIARKILNARKDKKAITFSATIKMAESIGIGETIHSQKKSKENKEIIERFNDAATGVLNTSKSADQGVDCKGVNLEVILHTDSSKIRKVQRLGRSIRFEEGKIAEIFTLVIAGTQEVKWLGNSKTSKVITINEEQLDQILAGDSITTREREYAQDYDFRF